MLTYALVDDFLKMKNIGKSGFIVPSDTGTEKIDAYLERATRFIERTTRRDFIPWIETREFSLPYAYIDLRIRSSHMSQLALDADLLELHSLSVNDQVVSTDDYFLLEHNTMPKSLIAPRRAWTYRTTNLLKRYDDAIIKVTGLWGYAEKRYPDEFWIDTGLTLDTSGGITSTQTTFTVSSAAQIDNSGHTAFIAGRMLRIDNELMELVSVNTSTNVLTVRRGMRGSTKAIHTTEAEIKRWRVMEDIVEATLQVAKTWREADIAAGGRIGVGDISVGAEISIPSDPLRVINSYQRSMLLE